MVGQIATPPVLGLPFGTVRNGLVYLNPNGLQFLTQVFNAAQGASATIPDSALISLLFGLLGPATPGPSPSGGSTVTLVAAEDLADFALVNCVSGEFQNASATDNTKPAQGLVVAGVSMGAEATASLPGALLTGLSGLSAGAVYFLDTAAGGMTATPPVASGNFTQEVGWAPTTTSFVFAPKFGFTQP